MGYNAMTALCISSEEIRLNTAQTIEDFLSDVEKRAYRMAVIATSNRDDALEIVQDAMMKLVSRYANKDADDWGPLFHRILQSTIRDWYRRNRVRNGIRQFFPDQQQMTLTLWMNFQTIINPNPMND